MVRPVNKTNLAPPGPKAGAPNQEKIISACAQIWTKGIYAKSLPLSLAKDIVCQNRNRGGIALYAAAAEDIADFVATGLNKGVFIDTGYSEEESSDYEETFKVKAQAIGISDLEIKRFGKIEAGGYWQLKFSFQGEQKEVTCYAISFSDLFVRDASELLDAFQGFNLEKIKGLLISLKKNYSDLDSADRPIALNYLRQKMPDKLSAIISTHFPELA